jgi:hypothetical protein
MIQNESLKSLNTAVPRRCGAWHKEWTFPVVPVAGRRRYEIEIVDVETQNAKRSWQTRKIAVDQPLEVGDVPAAPILHMLGS